VIRSVIHHPSFLFLDLLLSGLAEIMSATLHSGGAAEHDEKNDSGVTPSFDKPVLTGNVVEINAASVALAAAIEAQKPKLLSKNMLKLYFIMVVGYLVSTMNGFGRFCSLIVCLSLN